MNSLRPDKMPHCLKICAGNAGGSRMFDDNAKGIPHPSVIERARCRGQKVAAHDSPPMIQIAKTIENHHRGLMVGNLQL